MRGEIVLYIGSPAESPIYRELEYNNSTININTNTNPSTTNTNSNYHNNNKTMKQLLLPLVGKRLEDSSLGLQPCARLRANSRQECEVVFSRETPDARAGNAYSNAHPRSYRWGYKPRASSRLSTALSTPPTR